MNPGQAPAPGPRRAAWPGSWVALGLLALLLLGVGWLRLSAEFKGSPLLRAANAGTWIRRDAPYLLNAQPIQPERSVFRHRLEVTPQSLSAPIEIAAREEFLLFLDHGLLYACRHQPEGLEQSRSLTLPANLAPGPHELEFVVIARHGTPLLSVSAPALGLATDAGWEASEDATHWLPALPAAVPWAPELAGRFPGTFQALGRVSGWLLLAFLAGALCSRWRHPDAGLVRWAFLLLWAALACNNIYKLPARVGMDIAGHLEYVSFLLRNHRIPLATEGWQLFQPPLTYLLSLPAYLLHRAGGGREVVQTLRILPLLCGLLQVEVSYRVARSLFPERQGLQIAGTAIGAFLPMNIYISQSFGNEPLAGLLSSLCFLWVLQRGRTPGTLLDLRFGLGLGALLGLALLAKVTVLLVIPVLLGYCLLQSRPDGPRGAASLRFLAVTGAALALTAGWYFGYVWAHLGRPFIGGWDPARGIAYWQYPGYVTWQSLLAFGTALVRPVYAASAGFWNGVYSTLWLDGNLGSMIPFQARPPWNYSFLLASALTALAPCAAMAAGAAAGWRKPEVRLCLACLGVLLASILWLHVSSVPSYASIKATYLMGLLPCFVVLAGTGLAALPRRPWLRAGVAGLLCVWVVSVYAAYWVR